MTLETNTETLDSNEQIVKSATDPITDSPVVKHYEVIKSAIQERFIRLEKIKSDIPPKTYDIVLKKLKSEESEILTQFQKESEQKAEREKITQTLPKSYFEQRFLRIKEIRID
jgi:hypothetical protein